MLEKIWQLLETNGFIPHGHCYLWQTNLVGLHVLADGLTAIAYFSIPIMLFYFVRNRHEVKTFNKVYLLFGAFIIACGITHVMEIWTLWYPVYWVSGLLKAITAIISMYTAFELVSIIPVALAMPSAEQLIQVNQALETEILERRSTEIALRESEKRYQSLVLELEERVKKRTSQLALQNMSLETARRESELANRAKSDFLAMVSHEIRTPMNGIIGMTNLLLDTYLSNKQHNFATIVRNSGEELLKIINDILDFSKIESGKLDLEQHPFDLRSCVKEVLILLNVKAEEKNVDLSYDIESIVPTMIVGDVTRLRQILINLIGNAIKFTQKGEVHLSITASALINAPSINEDSETSIEDISKDKKYELLFLIRDSGIGIPPDRIAHLFQAFTQVDASTTRNYGGTGLGLVICKQLTNLMGGTIWVESFGNVGGSAPPNWLEQSEEIHNTSGSSFYFTVIVSSVFLKFFDQPQQTVVFRDRLESNLELFPSNLASQFPLKILVAEDNSINQQLIELMLEQLGYDCDIVNDGIEVIEAVDRCHYDLILMDIQMPKMSGIEATQIIRSKNKSQSVRIVAVTASAMQDDRQNFLKAGIDEYLSKPIRINELVQTLLNYQSTDIAETLIEITETKNTMEDAQEQKSIDMQIFQDLQTMIGSQKNSPVIVSLIDSYLQDLPEFRSMVANGIRNQDASSLQIGSHSLKSSSASLGATNLANICRDLEKKVVNNAIAYLSEDLLVLEARFNQECDRVKLALEEQKQIILS